MAFLPVMLLPLLIVGLVAGWRYTLNRSAVELSIQDDLQRTSLIRKAFIDNVLQNSVDSLESIAVAWPKLRGDQAPNETLQAFSYRLSAVSQLRVASADGRIRYSSNPRVVGTSIAAQPYWQEFRAARTLTFSDLVRERNGRRVILILLPLAGGETLVATYDTEQLQVAFRTAGLAVVERATFLVDRHGQLITHSDDRFLTANANLAQLPPVHRALQGYSGTMTFREPATGLERSAAYLPLPETNWALVLVQPSAGAILLPADIAQRDTLLVLAGGVMLTILATSLLSRRLATPVEQFGTHLEHLSREQVQPELAATLAAQTSGVVEYDRVIVSATVLYEALAKTITQLQARSNELFLAKQETEASVENLKRLDKLRADFLNALSHDLRIPITAIMGNAELLQDLGSLGPAEEEFVQQILEGCNTMQEMVEELLDYARLEMGKLKLHIELLDLRSSLLEAEAFFKPLAQQKHLRLSSQLPHDLPEVETDPDRLRQILNNLISNAIKYTLPGGKVTLHAFPAGDKVVVEVRDTGVGLSDEDKHHLFEQFYRSPRPEVQQEKGSGIGLSLVKGTVEALGGHLEVESEVGTGSTFRFTLPVASAADLTPSPQAEEG